MQHRMQWKPIRVSLTHAVLVAVCSEWKWRKLAHTGGCPDFCRRLMAAIVPPIVCLFQELWHTVLSENLHFMFWGSWQAGWQVLAVRTPCHPVCPPLKLMLLHFISVFHSCPFSEPHSSVSIPLLYATAAMTYVVKAILVCVFMFKHPPVCEQYCEGLLCVSPRRGSPVCVSRYRMTLMCQLYLEEWTESWWTTVTHIHTHRKPPQGSPYDHCTAPTHTPDIFPRSTSIGFHFMAVAWHCHETRRPWKSFCPNTFVLYTVYVHMCTCL